MEGNTNVSAHSKESLPLQRQSAAFCFQGRWGFCKVGRMEIHKKRLGKSDLWVSPVAVGCWQFAGGTQWGAQEEKDSHATVHAALDAGLQFFDTAPMYGKGTSEEILGRALVGRREEAVIASKVNSGDLRKEDLMASCETSLRRLQTDRIDLLQVHWGNRKIPLQETVEAFESLLQQGKIRAYGVCNFSAAGMREAIRCGARFATHQLPYSLLWRAIEFEIIPTCEEAGISVLPYSPLLQGLLTGKFRDAEVVPPPRRRSRHFSSSQPEARHGEPGEETATFAALDKIRTLCDEWGQPMGRVALAWLLHQTTVASVLAGSRSPEQVRENLFATTLSIPPEINTALEAATRSLRDRFGSNPDMWQSNSRFV